MNVFSASIILSYIVILFALSAFFIKKALNSYMEYNFCGRSLSIGFVIFTYLGTWIGGGTIIGLASKSYTKGVEQYWLFGITCVIGFFFALFFLPRIRKLQLMGLGDMMALRFPKYHEAVRIPISIGLIVRNVTMIGMQFTAMSYMLTYSLQIDRNLAVLATFVIVTAYTSLSGLWGVVATDVFQGFLQIVGLLILLYLTLKISGGITSIWEFYQTLGLEDNLKIVGKWQFGVDKLGFLIAFGTFFLMGDQGDWERIHSCKTDKTAFWGYLIPLTITLMLLLIPAYIGVFQKVISITGTNPEYIIYWFIFEKLNLALSTFVLLTLFSAILSSADSFMLASGVIFSNDIVKRFINKEAKDKELIFWTRSAVIIAGAIGFAFAINLDDIVYLWIAGIGIATMIAIPAYFCGWFSKRVNTEGVLAGMAVGILYSVILILIKGFIEAQDVILGISINYLITYIVSLKFEKPLDEIIMSTYYWSNSHK